MQKNSIEAVRPDRDTGLRLHRAFFVLIAGAVFLCGCLAASISLFGPSLTPAHISKVDDPEDHLTLAHVTPVDGIGQFPSAAHQEQLNSPSQEAAPRSPSINDAAKRLAKAALAEKLADLHLALSPATARLAQEDGEAQIANSSARPAENQSTETQAAVEAIVTASLPEPQTSIPGDPATLNSDAGNAVRVQDEETSPHGMGAIEQPLPGIKPKPPARIARTAVGDEEQVTQTLAPVLAYATPGVPEKQEGGAFSGIGKLFSGLKGGLPGRGSGIAVYDISAATVHMPDGTKLEAHSGIGHRKDNPKFAHVRNLGPTPPNIYDLRMREKRFHGVEAIRMLPRDHAAMKGRDGMLAHTPLLRRSNGSHGCVAFKDYNKFLKAFKAGKVKKMIVVPSMEKLPKYMAALNRGAGA